MVYGNTHGLALHVWCVAVRKAWCCTVHVWCVAGGTVTQRSGFWATDMQPAAWQTPDSGHANPGCCTHLEAEKICHMRFTPCRTSTESAAATDTTQRRHAAPAAAGRQGQHLRRLHPTWGDTQHPETPCISLPGLTDLSCTAQPCAMHPPSSAGCGPTARASYVGIAVSYVPSKPLSANSRHRQWRGDGDAGAGAAFKVRSKLDRTAGLFLPLNS